MEKSIANTMRHSLPRAKNRGVATRTIPLLSIAVATLGLLWYRAWTIQQLGNEGFATGYVLLATIVGLAALGVRKRLRLAPIGPVASWQRVHHYLGIFCLIAYCLHAKAITTGWFESVLAVLFWTILLSGFLIWYVNKSSPRKLRAAGVAILREDIPSARVHLCEQAYAIVLQAAGSKGSVAIADLYRSELAPYFSKPRSVGYWIVPTGKRKRSLMANLNRLDRYLDDHGRDHQSKLSVLIQKKDDLDFQLAIQYRIRFCAVFHTLLLGAFVLFAITHVVLAHQFSSHW